MRYVCLTILTALFSTGCVPWLLSPRTKSPDLLVKVPARTGSRVSVKSPSPNLAVWHRGEAVPCKSNGFGDIEFDVRAVNRHSPYLVYELGPADVASCQRIEGPSQTDFQAKVRRTVTPDLPALAQDTDYLILTPGAYLPLLQPLIQHRRNLGHRVTAIDVEHIYQLQSGGNPDPHALKTAVDQFYAYTGGALRYLMLVGDVRKAYSPSLHAVTPVPTFYMSKVEYPDFESDTEYPTDHPYSIVRGRARLAVGRLPVQSANELKQQVQKIIRYETQEASGAWQRRLVMYGGPTDFGTMIDSLIEKEATRLLNDKIPYDFDLELVFANLSSPCAYRFDQLSQKLVSDINKGALLAAYVGHGLPNTFDEVEFRESWYSIGHSDDMAGVKVATGKPFFLSFACHTGAFDSENGLPSIAEKLALNPAGPIAVFASSRASHPYPNSLYARRIIDRFLQKQPKTIGDGLLAVKEKLQNSRNLVAETFVQVEVTTLRDEHVGLYNLLGDPATRLRYPTRANVVLENPMAGSVKTGELLRIAVDSPQVQDGNMLVTIETPRKQVPESLISPDDLKRMSTKDAFIAMANNHKKAMDKVLSPTHYPMTNGRTILALNAPEMPGRYFVKVFVQGETKTAMGHAEFSVNAP